MRVLVLGGTGFIGGSLVRSLVAAGHGVRILRRQSGPSVALEGLNPSDIEERIGDVRSREAVGAALADCDALVHVAGYYPTSGFDLPGALRKGVASVRPAFEAAREHGISRVLYVSSLSTIGRPSESGRLADERDFYHPGASGHPYPEAKFAMEAEAYRFIARGLPIVIACPTAVFGPGDVKPTSGAATIAVVRGRVPIYITGQTNVVDVRDVADGLVAALEKGRVGEKYLLGGWNVTARDLIGAMAAAASVPAPKVGVPAGLAFAAASAGERLGSLLPSNPARYLTTGVEQVRHGQFLDCTKAERELGMRRRPLAETFGDSLEWFRRHGYLQDR